MALSKLIFVIAISMSVTILVSFSYAEAISSVKVGSLTTQKEPQGIYKIIAIELSKVCDTANKAGNTKCPSYKILFPFDTTDQRYYGKIVSDNHTAFRLKGSIKNPHIVDQYRKDYVICVDCPQKVLPHAKLIEIVPELKNWIDRRDNVIVNNTRYEYNGMYVENCITARIPYSMLNATINYLKSDCKEPLNLKQTIIKPYSKLTYDGKEAQYQQWLKQAKETAMKLAREKCQKSQKC